MKIKKATMLSLVLALALIVGVTTAFATSAESSSDDGREISLDEGNFITGDVGDESNGLRVVESTSRWVDLPDLKYVEGDVGTEAHGMKITD